MSIFSKQIKKAVANVTAKDINFEEAKKEADKLVEHNQPEALNTLSSYITDFKNFTITQPNTNPNTTIDWTYQPLIDNAFKIQPFTTTTPIPKGLEIKSEGVTINLDTGEVIIKEAQNIPLAALEFWKYIGATVREVKLMDDKKYGALEALMRAAAMRLACEKVLEILSGNWTDAQDKIAFIRRLLDEPFGAGTWKFDDTEEGESVRAE